MDIVSQLMADAATSVGRRQRRWRRRRAAAAAAQREEEAADRFFRGLSAAASAEASAKGVKEGGQEKKEDDGAMVGGDCDEALSSREPFAAGKGGGDGVSEGYESLPAFFQRFDDFVMTSLGLASDGSASAR